MPYTLTVPEGEGLFRLKLTGVLTADDLLQFGMEIAELERTRAGSRLTDLTGLTGIAIGFLELEAYVKRNLRDVLPNDVKSALVAATPVTIGFARMFQTLTDNPQVDVRIFPDEASARAWLQEPT